jgi:hypothetical protein
VTEFVSFVVLMILSVVSWCKRKRGLMEGERAGNKQALLGKGVSGGVQIVITVVSCNLQKKRLVLGALEGWTGFWGFVLGVRSLQILVVFTSGKIILFFGIKIRVFGLEGRKGFFLILILACRQI